MQTNLDKICQDLCGFLAENILADDVAIDAQTSLADVGVDSFSLVEIILFIERQFGVTLAEDSLTPENLINVKALAQCLQGQMQ